MTKRDVVFDALGFRTPAYVPWSWGMTIDCANHLREYLKTDDLGEFLDDHFLDMQADFGPWEEVRPGHFRDEYGVVWDRSIDKDIGTPSDWPIRSPRDLDRYAWPDVGRDASYAHVPRLRAGHPDRFSRYMVGFSLFERAWTMRSMPELLMDMVERPEFVGELLDAIVERNLVQIRKALACGVDAVYFGDDYGMQTGLIMGAGHWRRLIKPRLARMFAPVHAAGKVVSMHSCGCVASVFDDLVEIGLELFNPFQPEVMDVFALIPRYRGRLAFHGGMSIQKTLPFGTEREVRQMTRRLLDAGGAGGYVFSPSHAVPRDVPPQNLVAMVEVLKAQPGYAAARGPART